MLRRRSWIFAVTTGITINMTCKVVFNVLLACALGTKKLKQRSEKDVMSLKLAICAGALLFAISNISFAARGAVDENRFKVYDYEFTTNLLNDYFSNLDTLMGSIDSVNVQVGNEILYRGTVGAEIFIGDHALGVSYDFNGLNMDRIDQKVSAKYRYRF